MRLVRIAAAALLAVSALAGCSSSSSDATMSVTLVDAPSPGYREVNVDVQRVEIASSGGWILLGTPDRVVNLLSLTGGVTATLVEGATLPAGHYGQLRLVLGSRNTVKLLDGTVEDLKVPSGQQSGVKMTVSFDVEAGTTRDVYVDFDAHRSIFVHATGGARKYLLRPTVRAFDRLETGSISGVLTDAGTQAPIAGVTVMAEILTGEVPSVVRSATTDAAGRYVLDLLPRGGTYHVVGQPVIAAVGESPAIAYEARASDGIPVTEAAPVRTWDAAFTRAAATGDVDGNVLPAAAEDQADTIQARTSLLADGAPRTFIVREVAGEVGASSEQFSLTLLPAADPSTGYWLVGERRTLVGELETTVTTSPQPIDVAPGSSITTTVQF